MPQWYFQFAINHSPTVGKKKSYYLCPQYKIDSLSFFIVFNIFVFNIVKMGNAETSDKYAHPAEVINASTILDDIGKSMKKGKPSIEYIVVLPYSNFRIPFTNWGFNINTYGHSALRYRFIDKNGKWNDVIMNIEAKVEREILSPKPEIVRYYKPEDYLFTDKSQQAGIFNRNMISVAYYDVPNENIVKMHEYFENLKKESIVGHKKFDIILGPIINRLRNIFPEISERGNCAKWTSEGLKVAGVIKHTHIWPKSLWITLFENNNLNYKPTVVYYKKIPLYKPLYGNSSEIFSQTAPFQLIRDFIYS
ncbi:MAG: hypothetical protein EB127_15315, partial [Alphaproteobacteria bacterium]|nr:hypothetical protein [Alphaproteobacteria bacterium]